MLIIMVLLCTAPLMAESPVAYGTKFNLPLQDGTGASAVILRGQGANYYLVVSKPTGEMSTYTVAPLTAPSQHRSQFVEPSVRRGFRRGFLRSVFGR